MNKDEFCKRTGQTYEKISEDDWEIIQTVYNYHPLISDVKGKDELCSFFIQGGMGLMDDMYSIANEISLHEGAVQQARVAKDNIQKAHDENMVLLKKQHQASMDAQNEIIQQNVAQIVKVNERYKYGQKKEG